MVPLRFQLRDGPIQEEHFAQLTNSLISFETWNVSYDTPTLQRVCDALARISTLEDLYIGNTYFDAAKMEILSKLFQTNRNIKSVSLPYIEDGVESLSHIISTNSTLLRTLTLSYSAFTSDNVFKIIQSLRTNATVLTLSVASANSLGKRYLDEIISILDDNTTLECVNVGYILDAIKEKLARNALLNERRRGTLFDRLFVEHLEEPIKRQRLQ